jgi:hypothetical protein
VQQGLHSQPKEFFDIFMSKGYYIIVWRCAPFRSWRQNSFDCFSRWPWNTLRNYMCFACCRKEWGKRYTMRRMERGLWGVGKQWTEKKKAFSSIFTTDTKSFIHVTRIAAMHIIFTPIGCILFTCDMYMCRLRHINDSVLSSLKMEGIRLLFSRGMRALPKRWNTCMELNGDYIEKWSHCVPFVFNKLQDKKYLKFSFESPSYLQTLNFTFKF